MGDRLKRRKRNDGSQFEPSWFSILLCKRDFGHCPENASRVSCDYRYVKASVSKNYQINLEVGAENLEPGRYVVMIQAIWNKCARNAQFQQFCLQIVSKEKVKIEDSDITEGDCKSFMESSFLSKALQDKNKGQVLLYDQRPGAFKLVQSKAEESFYGIVAVVNESNKEISEEIIFTKLDSFSLWGDHAGSK
mmetsp:Transcript_21825/g.33783  ORF Transcript_21825/g.33783 Transcript_21825/m.33783 type:complete len:192 (-) Transcript_21825:1155-1730(-)